MKRVLILLSLVALVGAISVSSSVQAAKADKVQICHKTGVVADGLDGGNCVVPNRGAVKEGFPCGFRITVNSNALPAHVNHGDRTIGGNQPDGAICSPDRAGLP